MEENDPQDRPIDAPSGASNSAANSAELREKLRALNEERDRRRALRRALSSPDIVEAVEADSGVDVTQAAAEQVLRRGAVRAAEALVIAAKSGKVPWATRVQAAAKVLELAGVGVERDRGRDGVIGLTADQLGTILGRIEQLRAMPAVQPVRVIDAGSAEIAVEAKHSST